MLQLTSLVHVARSLLRSRRDLVLENLALRQQLGVLDRMLWVILHWLWPKWKEALIIVQPDTVIRWHRDGFRRYWRWKPRRGRVGRPRIEAEIRDLVRRLANENPTWGAPRVHSELRMLGFDLSERTVSRYMPRKPVDPAARQLWVTFLRNHRHALAASDFFTVPTVTFRMLYVFFVIHYDRRRILHVRVTTHPCAEWICQQLREAFPYDRVPRYLIFDRDAKFGHKVTRILKAMGVKTVRAAYRSPWQKGYASHCTSVAWFGTTLGKC
jgi:hypothetical protein